MTETTRTKNQTPIPTARMAVISLSAASRLRPSRMPTSTAMGMVRLRTLGSMNTKILATVPNEALLRAAISSSCPTYFMNRMKVKSAPPRSAWESTSFQI